MPQTGMRNPVLSFQKQLSGSTMPKRHRATPKVLPTNHRRRRLLSFLSYKEIYAQAIIIHLQIRTRRTRIKESSMLPASLSHRQNHGDIIFYFQMKYQSKTYSKGRVQWFGKRREKESVKREASIASLCFSSTNKKGAQGKKVDPRDHSA
jgi:hypothetical protein